MMWVNKKDPRAIYYDRRNEDYEIKPNAAYPNGTTLKVRPDVQGDFGAMPFPDDSFRLVVFDPPHESKSESGREENQREASLVSNCY